MPEEGPVMILAKVRDPRLVTIRRGGTLTDSDHHLFALWAAPRGACPWPVRVGPAGGPTVASGDLPRQDRHQPAWRWT